MSAGRVDVALTANFNVEPLVLHLRFWIDELGIPADIQPPAYNQLFQDLLGNNPEWDRAGLHLVLVRPDEWTDAAAGLAEFLNAFHAFRQRVQAACLLCIASDAEIPDELIQSLTTGAVKVRTARGIADAFDVAHIVDPIQFRLGHVPFTDDFFAALAADTAMTLQSLVLSPRKVLVLDCDGTLWDGVCGEAGPNGVRVDRQRGRFQDLLIHLHESGVLLSLCSMNSAEDVWDVFDCNPGMRLQRSHISAARIDWNPKSANITDLSRELGLPLSSFVFVDDDPVQCAEVRSAVPDVVVVQMSTIPVEIRRQCDHFRFFDRWSAVTAEDRLRAATYGAEAQRRQLESSSDSFADFIRRLCIEIVIEDLDERHFARVAQLSARTTQFNMSGHVRIEGDLAAAVAAGLRGRVTSVRDRFGDYGLVGAALFRTGTGVLEVETFLLSCRALGRGIEHRMVADLGNHCGRAGLRELQFEVVETRRNGPARRFLCDIAAQAGIPAEWPLRLEAERAGSAVWTSLAAEPSAPPQATRADEIESLAAARSLERAFQLACDPQARRYAWKTWRGRGQALRKSSREGLNPVEQRLAEMWSDLLGVDDVGVDDNFFRLGGHSLMLVQMGSRLYQLFGVELTLATLFDSPTIASLSRAILEEQARSLSVDEALRLIAEVQSLSPEEQNALLRTLEESSS